MKNARPLLFVTIAAVLALVSACTKQEQPDGNTSKRVGILLLASHSVIFDLRNGFKERLDEIAKERGATVVYDEKNAEGNAAQLNQLAAYFTRRRHDLVYAVGADAALKLKSRESELPVVFAGVPDPARNGFVESLGHPGGNLTGVRFLPPAGLILDLQQQLHPETRRVAVLRNPAEINSVSVAEPFIEEAKRRNLDVLDVGVTESSQIVPALNRIRASGAQAVFIPTDNLVYQNLKQVAASLSDAAIPFVSVTDAAVKAGAEFSVGALYHDVGRECAEVAARLLFDGSQPATTPVLDLHRGFVFVSPRHAPALEGHVPEEFPLKVIGQ